METNSLYSDRLWKATDVARYLNVSRSQVGRWIADEAIPMVRITERIIRFEPEAVKAWAATRAVGGAS